MGETATIEATIPGDWRIVAGILTADIYRIGPGGQRGPRPTSTPLIRGVAHITAHTTEGIAAEISLQPIGRTTVIQVRTHPHAVEEWHNRIAFLAEAVGNVAAFEEWERPTAEDVIETYYRRRAAGTKVTLKQLAQETGYSLAYIKVAKRRYDAAGRWGSKKRSEIPANNKLDR